MKRILITGVAGFIGFHAAGRFLKADYEVIGLDSVNDYYDVNLKWARLKQHGIYKQNVKPKTLTPSSIHENYSFIRLSLEDKEAMRSLFEKKEFDYVLHLAAQAGVRDSLINPYPYIHYNVEGFLNILEGCRHHGVKHLVYASTSSVYGLNERKPSSVLDCADHPMSLYAATKKANELMAHTYSHLYGMPTTGLRFFTVYGPWGRPDMALFKFVANILHNKPIEVFNHGNMKRDFTYVDDIVENLFLLTENTPQKNPKWDAKSPNPSISSAPYRLLNIGCNEMVDLMRFIECIETNLGKKAQKKMMPMQPGDVANSLADVNELIALTDYPPKVSVEEGVKMFIEWYLHYYKIQP